MLTDHPMCPVMNVDIRLFGSGFVVDRIEKELLPMLVTFGAHVQRMWTVDIGDCQAEALRDIDCTVSLEGSLGDIEGYLVVLALKDFSSSSPTSNESEGAATCIQYNTTERVLPSFYSCRHIAFLVPTSSRHSGAFSTALRCWRDACRMNDVSDIRGMSNGDEALPSSVKLPLLVALDSLGGEEAVSSREAADSAFTSMQPCPGMGYLQMRYDCYFDHHVQSCK